MFNVLSIGLGALAVVFLLLGIIPLLGWTNWILTVPAAIIGLVLGVIGKSRGGVTLNVVVLGLAALRLLLGGGIL